MSEHKITYDKSIFQFGKDSNNADEEIFMEKLKEMINMFREYPLSLIHILATAILPFVPTKD